MSARRAGSGGARGERGGVALAVLALVAAGLGAYWPSLDGPFVLDDVPSIVESPNVRAPGSLADALGAPPGTGAAGRPVVALTLALDAARAGGDAGGPLDPRPFHQTNVLVHVLCALALFGLARRALALAERGPIERGPVGRGPVESGPVERRAAAEPAPSSSSPTATAFAIALLWVVHPLCTDALNHVVYRNEALMALFFAATLYAFGRGLGARRPGLWYALAVLLCALGMASKEPMVACPLVVLLVDRAYGAGSLRGALRARWPVYAGLAATWGLLAGLVATSDRGASVGLAHASAWGWAKTQAGVVLEYLRLALWPAPLVMDAGPLPLDRPLAAVWPAGLTVLALVLASGWLAWRRPRIGVWALAVWLVLAPSSSVIPLAGEIAAEHRMYLPLAGLVALAVLAARRALALVPAPRVRLAAGAVLVAGCAAALGATTLARHADWASVEAIWRDTAAKRPRNWRAHEHLGDELARQGRLAEAVESYERALALRPGFAKVHFNLANALEALGRRDDAALHYDRAVRLDPTVPQELLEYGVQLCALGRRAEGLPRIRRAAALSPETALRAATILATAPDPRVRDGATALEIAERIAARPGGATPRVLATVAAAQAETGDFARAVATAERALERARAADLARLVERLEAQLAGYRAGRAAHAGS